MSALLFRLCSAMSQAISLREERWGPWRAALFRLIIPAGLIGAIPLLLLAGMLMHSMWVPLVAYPIVVGTIVFCSVRNTILTKARAKWLAAIAGVFMSAVGAALALGLIVASGGV
jgi:hypothetical protein